MPALVAELVDALDLGSSDSCRVGSSPIRRTHGNVKLHPVTWRFFVTPIAYNKKKKQKFVV